MKDYKRWIEAIALMLLALFVLFNTALQGNAPELLVQAGIIAVLFGGICVVFIVLARKQKRK